MKTIWVVDDDEIIQFIIKRSIQNISPDFNILSFINGEEAIEALLDKSKNNQLPDIILLDINMPVMDGWEFISKFDSMKSNINKKVAIYILTSSTALEDKKQAKQYESIINYINKPIEASLLKEILYT